MLGHCVSFWLPRLRLPAVQLFYQVRRGEGLVKATCEPTDLDVRSRCARSSGVRLQVVQANELCPSDDDLHHRLRALHVRRGSAGV